MSGTFSRIQCTPDLMPNDIVGTQMYSYETGTFTTQLGPVHANVVLLDEINRSSAKTQSAMLEAMQEGQTSIGGAVYELPRPFTVMATQNPIEEEGTYVLPEAQMDRFLMKEVLTYPKPAEEVEILTRTATGTFNRRRGENPVTTEDVLFLQNTVQRVYVDDAIKKYIVAIVNTTRGGGPRPRRPPTWRSTAEPRLPTTPRPSAGSAESTAEEAAVGRLAGQGCGDGRRPRPEPG